MRTTYRMTKESDPSDALELSVDESMGMAGYVEKMTEVGYRVEVIGADGSTSVFEPKVQDKMSCDACYGGTLHLVSMDDGTGYSCDNVLCWMHMKGTR